MKSLLSILAGLFFFVGCASVGAVIEGGKEFTTGVVDGSVKAVSTISGAVLEDASNIVETTTEVTTAFVQQYSANIQMLSQQKI